MPEFDAEGATTLLNAGYQLDPRRILRELLKAYIRCCGQEATISQFRQAMTALSEERFQAKHGSWMDGAGNVYDPAPNRVQRRAIDRAGRAPDGPEPLSGLATLNLAGIFMEQVKEYMEELGQEVVMEEFRHAMTELVQVPPVYS